MMRTTLLALAFAALAAPSAAHSAETKPGLSFPILDSARGLSSGAAYAADRIEIRLTADAARATPQRGQMVSALRRPHLSRLGVAAVDAAAGALGVWFEPEFPGERPPDPGSRATDFTTFYIAHVPAGTDFVSALERFRGAAGVASADPIGVVPVSAIPNDSLWSSSWWFDQVSGHHIHATSAWNVTTGDTSIVVAILDTGVLPYHPDLGGSVAGIAGQIWTNWTEQGGVAGVDDDGNGFIDDTWGWDFVANQSVFTGEDGQDEDNDPNDFAGHGTFVAGLIGALTDNTIGVSGTAWKVRLMPVRVGWSSNADPLGDVDMSYVAQGIRYATRMGASVINCSFSTLDQAGLMAAADEAIHAGVTIVCASGNGGQPHDLALREDVVAVAATDQNDQVAGFSNLGSFVDVSAPGVSIASTFIVHATSDSVGERQPAYGSLSGTSLAAPLVSGAVALMQAHQKELGRAPYTSIGAALRLSETADDISAENPSTTGYGAGRLNLYRALTDPPGSRVFGAGSTTFGPPVVLPRKSGADLALLAMGLQIIDGTNGNTLATASIPNGRPSQLAGADLGGGRGVGLFVGGTKGYIYGYDVMGNLLPGWPQLGDAVFVYLDGGPALGDLDGDGRPEVVCGSQGGNIHAWHVDGTRVAGFPIFLDGNGVDLAVAIAPVDSLPGAEIVAVTNSGDVHLIRWDGSEPGIWPVTISGVPVAPIVAGLGLAAKPAVIAAAGNQVHALAPDGTPRWTATLPGSVLEPPASADLDGDGSDEIIVATFAPATLCVFDSAGVEWTSRGFPLALPAIPGGPPVVGPLRPGGKPAILMMCNGGLLAVTDSAKFVPRFPLPGQAGTFPEIAELEGSGQTEVVAGSGADSLLYIYTAGVGTWADLASSWPAARANDARTGTRLYAPAIPTQDDIAPSAIADLTAGWSYPDSIVLTWTAPGNDGATGTASAYDLRVTSQRQGAGDFSSGLITGVPAPDSSSRPQRFAFETHAHGTPLFFSIRARDAAGNAGAPSNVAHLMTPLGGAQNVTMPELMVRGQPARIPVRIDWRGPVAAPQARRMIEIFDVLGRRVSRVELPGSQVIGTLQWNGRNDDQRAVPAGLYFARLTCGSLHAQARVVLLP
jgi:subtilisin family serine protease